MRTIAVIAVTSGVAVAIGLAASAFSQDDPAKPPADGGAGAGQTSPDTPPTTKVLDCTTSGCHAKQMDFRFQHAPAAASACDVCHSYVDPAKHTFTLKQEGAALCDFCHIGKTDAIGLSVHQPVKDGQCIKCHHPHGSEQRFLIRDSSTSELCLSCHQDVVEGMAHLHTPIARGDCLGCHKAHSSSVPMLLIDQGRDLCLRCHADVTHPGTPAAPGAVGGSEPSAPRVLAAGDHGSSPPSAPGPEVELCVHRPMDGDCTQCHLQHASNHPGLLKDSVTNLCSSCHEPIARLVAGATVPHTAVTVDRACLNCHAPHTSHDAKLLHSPSTRLCLDCHDKPITKADGTKVESVASMNAKGQHLHGPIVDGNCSGCHDVHGGTHRALLVKPYSANFYQPFDTDAYALCFACHSQDLATTASTTSDTAFRNGDRNLHYVHVVAPGVTGRSCRACHSTHSAPNERQVRASTEFGQWQIPLNLEVTATGGSCGAGCHRARAYDRENPVVYEAKPNASK